MPALAACQAQRTGDQSRPQPPEGRTRVSASLDREHPRFILDPLKDGCSPAAWSALCPRKSAPDVYVLPRRWVVERTLAWFTRNRRLDKDYERLPETGETFIYMAMSRILIKRLTKCLEQTA
jgi:transposase